MPPPRLKRPPAGGLSHALSYRAHETNRLHGGVVRGGALLRKPGLLLRIEAVAKGLAEFRCLPS